MARSDKRVLPKGMLSESLAICSVVSTLLFFSGCEAKRETEHVTLRPQTYKPVAQTGDVFLDLALKGSAGAPVLIISLINSSAQEIVVDSELVFLVGIEFFGKGGRRILPQRADQEDVRYECPPGVARLRTLAPGETLNRRIDLTRPFDLFRCGTVMLESDEEADSGWESKWRLPEGTEPGRIQRIRVTYSPDFCSRGGIYAYLGRVSEVTDLFEDDLEAVIETPWRPRTDE